MERKNKMYCAALAAMLMCAGIVTVFSLPGNTGAGDVGATVLTTSTVPDAAYLAAEWNASVGFGMAVGAGGAIYRMEDPAVALDDFTNMSTGIDDVWNDVIWDGSQYVICGYNASATANVKAFDGNAWTDIGFSSIGDAITGVAHGSAVGEYLFIGENGGDAFIKYYDGTGFNVVVDSIDTLPVSTDVLSDIVFIPGENRYMIVGNNSLGQGITYFVDEVDLAGTFNTLQAGETTDDPLYAIAWNIPKGYGLAVGAAGGVYEISSAGLLEKLESKVTHGSSWNFLDLAFYFGPGYQEAVIVGDDGDVGGRIVRFQDTSSPYGNSIANVTYGLTTPGPLTAVAYKDHNSPRYGIMFGTNQAYKYNALEAFRNINVNTIFPHIHSIEMVDSSGSVLNSRVDVDPGTGTVNYTIRVNAYHNLGWDENVGTIDLYLWWDDGQTGDQSNYEAGPNNNSRAHFRFTNDGDNGTFVAPSGAGAHEIELLGGLDSEWVGGPQDNVTREHQVDFYIQFNKQVWASIGAFTEAPGNPATNQSDKDIALNNANTWDIEATITGSSGGEDTAWDEFGIYKYTDLSVEGLPEEQTGSGAPLTLIELGPGDQDMTWTANYNYSLRVWVTDLYAPNTDSTIPATSLGVSGGDINSAVMPAVEPHYFGGAGETFSQDILGVTVLQGPNAAENSTSLSTIDAASETGDLLNWVCNIPDVPEDHYYGTMTYVLEQA